MAGTVDRLEVRAPVAVVFATRTQLLEAITTLPEQLDQNDHFIGRVIFMPRSGRNVIPGFKMRYGFSTYTKGYVPTFNLEIPNWAGVSDEKLEQLSDSFLTGGKPAEVITEFSTSLLGLNPKQLERLRVNFFPRLLRSGYRPESATISPTSNSRLGNIERVTLAYKEVSLDREVPTLTVGRKGHSNNWVERVIQEYGVVPN